jgi:hypothetical protein
MGTQTATSLQALAEAADDDNAALNFQW